MERPGFRLFASTRGRSVVASTPMKLFMVVLMLSGRRPLDDAADADPPEGRGARSSKLKAGWIG